MGSCIMSNRHLHTVALAASYCVFSAAVGICSCVLIVCSQLLSSLIVSNGSSFAQPHTHTTRHTRLTPPGTLPRLSHPWWRCIVHSLTPMPHARAQRTKEEEANTPGEREVNITAEEEVAVAAEEGVIMAAEPPHHRHHCHLPSAAVRMSSQQSQIVRGPSSPKPRLLKCW